jgi:hypothetical protein
MATFECSYDRSAISRFVNTKMNDSPLYQLLYYYFLPCLPYNHSVLVVTTPLINSVKILTTQKATALYSLRHIGSPRIAELTTQLNGMRNGFPAVIH